MLLFRRLVSLNYRVVISPVFGELTEYRAE